MFCAGGCRLAMFSSRGMSTWEIPFGYGRAKVRPRARRPLCPIPYAQSPAESPAAKIILSSEEQQQQVVAGSQQQRTTAQQHGLLMAVPLPRCCCCWQRT